MLEIVATPRGHHPADAFSGVFKPLRIITFSKPAASRLAQGRFYREAARGLESADDVMAAAAKWLQWPLVDGGGSVVEDQAPVALNPRTYVNPCFGGWAEQQGVRAGARAARHLNV